MQGLRTIDLLAFYGKRHTRIQINLNIGIDEAPHDENIYEATIQQ